jgi:hypothetical protein
MDIFFQDPTEIPLPPMEVRILELHAEMWEDGRRVQVFLEITPFQKRPHGEVSITNATGDELAFISIVEALTRKLEFTMHLRGAHLIGPFTLNARLYYYPEDETSDEEGTPQLPAPIEVDQRSIQIAQDSTAGNPGNPE